MSRGQSTTDLTYREIDVCELFNRGWKYKEIASSLGISEATVKTYLERAREKLSRLGHPDVNSRRGFMAAWSAVLRQAGLGEASMHEGTGDA